MQNEEKKGLDISVKSYVTSLLVIFGLMALTYALTFLIPAGHFERTLDEGGNTLIDITRGFTFDEAIGPTKNIQMRLPFLKWILSPLLVLGAEGSGTLLAVIAFLLIIGGVFNALTKASVMDYMLERLTARYASSRYKLLLAVSFFFMAMGAFCGSFEEVVPMVPIVTALSVSLGWDIFTGLGMSLIAVNCGFSSGVANPFTVGVAQRLSGIPMFSGMWFRLLSFVPIYALHAIFLTIHARKVERKNGVSALIVDSKRDSKMDRALVAFGSILGLGLLSILLSTFIPALQDYTMVIVALMFLLAGTVSSLLAGLGAKNYAKAFGEGIVAILPAVVMILMASSIRFILTEAGILDTMLQWVVAKAQDMPQSGLVLFVYLVVLVMNFFIPSGSAKAFLLIPLVVPVAQAFGISGNLTIMAYAFGDGFSNVFYPTNAALLLALGLAKLGYGEYVKECWRFQVLNLLLTSGLLLLGLFFGY